MVSALRLFSFIAFSNVYAKISTLKTSYSLGESISFSVQDEKEYSKTSVSLVNTQGPHPFTVQLVKSDVKETEFTFDIPFTFATGVGFSIQVNYEGIDAISYSSNVFEIIGDSLNIKDSSIVFNYPTRDVIVEIDQVYDIAFNQNYLVDPVQVTAKLIRADSIGLSVIEINSDIPSIHSNFEWHIGSDLITSKFYYIYVEAEFENSKSGSFSPQFTINNPNDVISADGVNVKFTFPKSENVLTIGQKYQIEWDFLVEPTSTIELHLIQSSSSASDASLLGTLVDSFEGKYEITVPAVEAGNFYQILLVGKIQDLYIYSELSQVFTINNGDDNGIQFSLPQSDDVYSTNQAYDVAYTIKGKSPSKVHFQLCKGAYNTFPIDQTISQDASTMGDFVVNSVSSLSYRVPVFVVSDIITLDYSKQLVNSFTFQVPFFITSAEDYFIRALLTYPDETQKEGNSATFTIKGDSDPSLIQVSLPIPGQVLKVGQVYNIGWTLFAIDSVLDIAIELFQAVEEQQGDVVVTKVNFIKTIATGLNARKITYMWTAEDGLDLNAGYYIRVVGDLAEKQIIGVSGEFYLGKSEVPLKFKVKRDFSKTQEMIKMYK